MCSISGFLIFNRGVTKSLIEDIKEEFKSILLKSEERGRDSFGIVLLTRHGEFRILKFIDRVSNVIDKIDSIFDEDAIAGIANCRAEPTTEFVAKKSINDVQPMIGNYIAVTHNGIIVNDFELEKKYNIVKSSRIDASIIPPLLEKKWNGTLEDLQKILVYDLIGSYALAILDRRKPGILWLATNFKPLYVMWDSKKEVLYFSSFDYYLQDLNKPIWGQRPIKRIEPYSVHEISINYTWRSLSLWKQDVEDFRKRKKVLVIASGGLDSTVVATLLVKQGFDVTLLHFNYRHRAEKKEKEAIYKIAQFLSVPVIEIDTNLFKLIGHSPLIGEGEINKIDMGREGAEFAHEWVPARNLIFYSIAIALAEAWGYDYIASGINLEEASAYPDNEMEFVRLLDKVVPYATSPQKKVRLLMPVGHLVKHEIVKLGLEIGAPLHLTWSCYEGGEKHCGRCGPCYMRRWAFKINGVKDPVEYDLPEDFEKEFWKNCKSYIIPKPIVKTTK